ncbi:unnamed protein product [Eretmochelys imbricata]
MLKHSGEELATGPREAAEFKRTRMPLSLPPGQHSSHRDGSWRRDVLEQKVSDNDPCVSSAERWSLRFGNGSWRVLCILLGLPVHFCVDLTDLELDFSSRLKPLCAR